mgnify:CR=1 FL=1
MKFDNIITMNTSIIVGGRRHYFLFMDIIMAQY